MREAPPRPELGPAKITVQDHTDPVEIVEVLGRRRCLVRLPSGALVIVPDGVLS